MSARQNSTKAQSIMKKSTPNILNYQRIINASHYSWQGLQAAWQYEGAFRQELLLSVLLLPFLYFADNVLEVLLLISSLLFLLIVELLNSAVEASIDRHGQERHELSKRAKDLGSAAVSLAFINMVCWWVGLLLW